MVIDDSGILGDLCGPNDENLRTLSYLLESKIVTRGNQILLESGDPQKTHLFQQGIKNMEEMLHDGNRIDTGAVKLIYEALAGDKPHRLHSYKETSIQIPQSYRNVFPRNVLQAEYIQLMENKDIVFALGPAGTGKTFLAVARALQQVLTHKIRKIILTRPVVETGESLGFLPGDLAQKISPYLRPLQDAMESLVSGEVLRKLEEKHMIEIAPLAYMRGRSLRNCCIILDEAQNTTREQMKMFLTRIGEESEAIITGDPSQVDLSPRSSSGLIEAEAVLRSIHDIGFIRFHAKDVIRNPLVRKIVEAYEQNS